MKLPDWVRIVDCRKRMLAGDDYRNAMARIPNLHLNMAASPFVLLCTKTGHTGGRQYETYGRAIYWAARPDTWCAECRTDETSRIARERVLANLAVKAKPEPIEPIPSAHRRTKNGRLRKRWEDPDDVSG